MERASEAILSAESVENLLIWYRKNRRDLPWRHTSDPYRIWLSEIMLQQTRVEAVKPYYARFLEECPTVEALAALPEERLLKLWEGLGYYSRARNLRRAALVVAEERGGRFPDRYDEIRALPGVGEYTAGAIASIAFGERVPAVDGNVLRVLSRVTASFDDISLLETKKCVREALLPVIPEDAGDFNQALIELGATVCIPNGEPHCEGCPLKGECLAKREQLTSYLPVKRNRRARRIEERTVLLLQDERHTAIGRRAPRGLLAGLYELPSREGHLSLEALKSLVLEMGLEPREIERVADATHIFTHLEWRMIAYRVRVADFEALSPEAGLSVYADREILSTLAIPSAFSAYIKYLRNHD